MIVDKKQIFNLMDTNGRRSALTLIDKYKHPQSIMFNECPSVSVNTLYALSIISIQQYNYLITRNDTINNVHNNYSLGELQFIALQNSDYDTAHQFVARTKEIMNVSADNSLSLLSCFASIDTIRFENSVNSYLSN